MAYEAWRNIKFGLDPALTQLPEREPHMISEGPALIEALSEGLQSALNGSLRPGETLLIAVRGNPREAFAATAERILVLKEPAISGVSPVEIRELPLGSVSNVRAEPKPIGGRLSWQSSQPGGPSSSDYPTPDMSKYELVANRLGQLTGGMAPRAGGP